MKAHFLSAALAVTLLSAVSCNKTENQKTDNTVTETETTSGTSATTDSTTTATTPAATSGAVATKTVGDWDFEITKLAVTGNILTAEINAKPNKEDPKMLSIHTKMGEVSYIDDATSKKVALLKDDAGNYMATPANSQVKDDLVFISTKDPVIASLKFPAPSAESKTVSLNIPNLGSFDGLAVTK